MENPGHFWVEINSLVCKVLIHSFEPIFQLKAPFWIALQHDFDAENCIETWTHLSSRLCAILHNMYRVRNIYFLKCILGISFEMNFPQLVWMPPHKLFAF